MLCEKILYFASECLGTFPAYKFYCSVCCRHCYTELNALQRIYGNETWVYTDTTVQ